MNDIIKQIYNPGYLNYIYIQMLIRKYPCKLQGCFRSTNNLRTLLFFSFVFWSDKMLHFFNWQANSFSINSIWLLFP